MLALKCSDREGNNVPQSIPSEWPDCQQKYTCLFLLVNDNNVLKIVLTIVKFQDSITRDGLL